MNTKNNTTALTIVAGFSIFTILFGAGNFMVPPTLGIIAGQKTFLASIGFIFTAVILPLTGLIGTFLFEGNYRAFYGRLGSAAGSLIIGLCMFIIGPGLVLPRIINICFEMIHPFIPSLTLLGYAIFMSIITFILAYKPTRLISILGYVITPIKITLIGALIILGFLFGADMIHTDISDAAIFNRGLLFGYETLDLLGVIFFGSVIFDNFKDKLNPQNDADMKVLARKGFIATLIGGLILSPIYVGMAYLGAYHGTGLEGLNHAQILSAISFRVIGKEGGFFAAIALMVACLATMIAISTVIGEYIQKEITQDRVGFVPSLVLILASSIVISLFGLTQLMVFSGNLGFILYPPIITLTLCNIAYKLFDFKPVKLPVAIVFVLTLLFHFGYLG